MLGLAKYRLRERRPGEGAFDFLDPESDGVVVEASRGVVEDPQRGSLSATLSEWLPDRLLKILFPVFLLFWLAELILRTGSVTPSRNSRPRQIVRRPDGVAVFTLRVSSGLFYDSRQVYDGQGRPIARFQSGSHSTVRSGFRIIDLRGCEEDVGEIRDRAWLGHVERSDGAYRFRLVTDPDAGRITPRTALPGDDPPETMVWKDVDHYDIDVSPALRNDATSEVLLLAAALAVAWSGYDVPLKRRSS